jgi:uroporphyrinogen-III decarboxylase
MEKKWEAMTPDEKQEALFQRWLSPEGVKFASPQAEKDYKARTTRIKDAVQMKKLPDRVPVFVLPSFFPIYHAGITPRDAMYDYDKCFAAFKKFLVEFQPDGSLGAAVPGPGRFFDILDYKLYSWPGHGVSPNASYQANEGEYMKVEEYDLLIEDPSNYFTHTYLPRVFGALEGWQMLPVLTGILEMYGVAFNFIPFGLPPVQASFQKLFEAGAEVLKYAGAIGAWNAETMGLGYSSIVAGYTKAPFDVLGDTLRGTRGLMTDMYRIPQKLLKAMEVVTPIMIRMGVGAAQSAGNPFVFIPLHKGADGFLSDEQYKKFYWPTFREVMMGLIKEGVVPFVAAEGGYNTRLEIVKDLPKGTTMWLIDQSDIIKAKKNLGQVACLAGNVPSAMLNLGTTQEITDYCKKIIEGCSKGGGFILSNGSFFDEAKAENVKAMVDAALKYGPYK